MVSLAESIPSDTSAHFEVLPTPVVDDVYHQNALTQQERDSSVTVSHFGRTQTRPYHAALFATRQAWHHFSAKYYWWAVASVRPAGTLNTTAPNPGVAQYLLVYDSRPLEPDLERMQATRGLRDFLRKDQCRMLKVLNQTVPIRYIFLNRARLRMPDLGDCFRETLWWIWNVVHRGDMPIEIGSELSDLRWKVVGAITLEFEHDEADTGPRADRKLILQSISRAGER
ncbi:hypothetical protein BO82DRAFT_358345 [Aspergillus uvarum CBS 121591]|uniref:Uncharacterized protein n=1 Tax=Aspergillus uvarum CBS 121591 TaxID=1448315 RepID=A0A319C0S9_9EURO|nr:hypothetical protein BO82DRAFT_358345 [Aspergillus uvarum CBS 121591]PYH77390.1 hypothetical protein BO82DRAFT_358345 [Aspergillus uvarum CBS 121591]